MHVLCIQLQRLPYLRNDKKAIFAVQLKLEHEGELLHVFVMLVTLIV